MQNESRNFSKENTETGVFDKYFGILKSDKNVSIEEMDITAKQYAVSRISDLQPFDMLDDFDNDEFPEFYESEIFPS